MWENAKNHPTEQAPKGGIGGKAEKRPFFIPHIAAKIGVNVGMVLKSRKYNYGMYADTAVLADWFYSMTEYIIKYDINLPGGTHDSFAADAMEDVNVFRYFLEKSAVIPFYFVLQ